MRTKVIMTICLFLLMVGKASAQWSVIDPTNIAQSIINSSNNIVHTSSTAQNMLNNFKETVKIYEQGKKYYDALKSVNNLVKDARKVQQTILMVGDITDIYINNYQKMMHDDNFSVEELSAIGFGYTKLLEESKRLFLRGYEEMMKRLSPEWVIFYGKVPEECDWNVIRVYPHYDDIVKRRKANEQVSVSAKNT